MRKREGPRLIHLADIRPREMRQRIAFAGSAPGFTESQSQWGHGAARTKGADHVDTHRIAAIGFRAWFALAVGAAYLVL